MWVEVITPLLSDEGTVVIDADVFNISNDASHNTSLLKHVDIPVDNTARLPVDTGTDMDGNCHCGTCVADRTGFDNAELSDDASDTTIKLSLFTHAESAEYAGVKSQAGLTRCDNDRCTLAAAVVAWGWLHLE